ncbi:MAG: carbohydrate ABC transporter substrate-binding protein [Anaerolineales bacterium]|uniref:ABC transporter substrate-binding protein n=1 Tax=Candidatus Villigracilis vicinus TaxID=3140679 RepID=UPI0031374637|nr:carbohydrate ABC transporter substrate-binding protein [Anaerolineales bacterium]MBK9780019.1 carbohydrate ABC transporter substrate-binding protein [Anaerolineales bacterium]
MNKKSVLWSVMSLLILASLVLAACAPAATEAPAEEPAATEAAATEAAATEAAAEESSLPEGDGKVEIFGGYGEAQAAAFQQALTEWGEANGIEVTFTSLASFDTDIKVKIEAGQEPDIAMWPQPGGLKALAADNLVPLDEVIDVSIPQSTLVPGWDTLAVVDGKLYGLPVSANQKSLVFYNPSAFEANGYSVPTNDAELVALEAKIIADGAGSPWCAGIESGGATGWPFTDWMEQYVLSLNGPEVYAQWISGEVDFASPEITAAADLVSARLLAEGQVNGGGVAMATTSFGDNAALFANGAAEGQCFMLRQGSFIVSFMPEDIQAEVKAGDYSHLDVFPIPTPEGGQAGVIGGGDLAAVFQGHVDQDVAKVAAFIFSPEVLKYQVATGDLSPHKTFDSSLYPNEMQRKIGEALANAAVFGFDASDQMPAEVNAEFWAAGTDFVAGRATWAEAAERIDSKYP